MKSLITLAVVLSSSTLLAAGPKAPSCPVGTETVYKCVAAPQASDGEFATELFQGITVCQVGFQVFLAFKDFNGDTKSGEVELVARPGGNTYSTSYPGGLDLSFSVVTGIPAGTKPAKLRVEVPDFRFGSTATFSCK